MKKKINGKNVFNFSVISLSLIVLGAFVVSENGLKDLINAVENLDVGWIVMAIISNIINVLIDAYLTYRLTAASSPGYTFRSGMKSCMVGQFFSAVTPFNSGEPMQVYLMSKQGVEPGISTATLTQRFLVYQTTLTAYSAISILLRLDFFNSALNPVLWGVSVFGFLSQAVMVVALLFFSFNRKLTHILLSGTAKLLGKIHFLKHLEEKVNSFEIQLEAFHKCNHDLFQNSRLVLECYVFTAIQLTSMFIIPYCIYRSFGLYGASIVDMICSQSFVSMATSFVPLPGAAGASELTFLGFFNMFFSPETLKPGVLVWRMITFYGIILFTAPFSGLSKQPKNTQSAA